MTQEDKQLLLKDLCARLPYGVKVLNTAEEINEICELDSIMSSRRCKNEIFVSLTLPDDSIMTGIENIKPYLRPMSSMTEEEKHELHSIIDKETEILYKQLKTSDYGIDEGKYHFNFEHELDFCLRHHFDYRGLIKKGLALEAPVDMYKVKRQ